MMQPWMIQLAINVPVAGAVIWVVKLFIAHLEMRERNLKVVSEGCHKVQREANQVIGAIAPVLTEVRNLLIKMNGR